MKKIVKLVPIMLLTIMLLSVFSTVMAATDPTGITIQDSTQFDTIGGKIIGMIQAIGNIISIAVLVILGIKYMMGSAEEKAEYKKTMIPYLVGAILIFAASNIAGFVNSFAKTL